uniref:Uncharacterized protein n=1 Tax=Staphylococcus aureus TaxID=1280 RepID=Q9LBY6_STAAU|nr:hypothetical protein [Staphylococcus aureus]BAB47628.1 hypothetical protein [Staphylococcus aureus]
MHHFICIVCKDTINSPISKLVCTCWFVYSPYVQFITRFFYHFYFCFSKFGIFSVYYFSITVI